MSEKAREAQLELASEDSPHLGHGSDKLEEVESGGVIGDEVQPDQVEVKKPRRKWKKSEKGGEKETDTAEDTKQAKPSPASVFRLFRYATWIDRILMIIGTLASMAHGATLPLLMLYFGDLTNAFINQAASASFVDENDDFALECGSELISTLANVSLNASMMAFQNNISTGSVDCNAAAFGVTLEQILDACFSSGSECLSNSDFIDIVDVLAIIFVAIGVGVLISAFIQITLFQTACERQVYKIRLTYYRSILRQNIGWFDANPSGELASRLSDDIEKIHDGIGDKLAIFIQWVTTFFTGFIIGFSKEWRLTLVLLGLTPFLAISGAFMVKVTAAFASKEQQEYASAGAVAEEVLSSIRTVVMFGGEYKEGQRYNVKLKAATKIGAKKGFSVGVSLGSVFLLIFTVYAIAFWFGAYLISTEDVQGGDILSVFFAVLIGAFSLGQAAPNLENLLTAAGAAGAIFETIDREPPIDSSSHEGLVPEKFDSTIEFKNVCFTYPTRPDVQVLDNLNLRVDVGQTMALVGPSGCGKSTTIQLLERFYDLDSGEILVGGNSVKDLNLKWLRNSIGVVSQEPVLFDTTIAENIRYGKEDATMEEIKAAAINANAHDFIMQLPDQYDTPVGEGGTQLSGGQKQRVAIARALVKDPKILLLDEATSALDTESEAIVQAALDHAREGRTTIVIAHRLSTIQQADVIASIEDGSVVEMGTHDELMANKGLYYDLVTAQSYGADELFAKGKVNRLFSRHRNRSERESESGTGVQQQGRLHKQVSIQKQVSVQRQRSVATGDEAKPGLQRQISEKKQKEWDKDIPQVSLLRVMKLNAREWWIILLGVLGAAVNGSIPPLFGIIFGEVLAVFALPADEVFDEVHPWAGLYIVLGVVSGLAVFIKISCFTISGEKLTSRLRFKTFRAMLRQEMGWFDEERNSTGALTTRLASDAGQVQGATGSRLGTLVETIFGLMLALVIAFVYSWVLTLLILALVPIIMFAGVLQLKALTGHATSNKKALEKAGKVAVDSIENIRTVAALSVEDNFFQQFKENVKKPYKRSLLNTAAYGVTYGFSQSTLFFMYAVIYRFGAFQVTRDMDNIAYESFEDVFRVIIALIFGAFSVGQASSYAPNYAKAKLSANRIFALLDREPIIDGYSTEGDELERTIGEVAVQDVNFKYPARPDVLVLQGLNVSVSPGKTLALVGPSGCGKSTVVSLLERFYDPTSGCLTVDGKDLRELNIRWLRSQIGIVSQEPVLFDASIAENIRYGANYRQVSDDEVIEAAKAANIHGFIETLPQGYSTNVGAKGTQMSGGQKQRIAIARALVRDPKILLLDEATSALDTESEKIVQEALDKAREGRTSIVIAHRLSTVYNADCIAVIQGGKVAEMGTHSELLQQKGIYYKLNKFQIVEEELEP